MAYVAFSVPRALRPRRPSPFSLFCASPFPLFLSRPLGVPASLGCLPRVEAAVLRRVSLRSCRGRVRAVRCEEETFLPTRRPQRVRSSRGGRDTRLLRPKHDPLPVYTVVLVVLPPLPFSPYCTRGTCASSLVRSHTSRSPGARHFRACSVREVVTVTWDPRPREPVEGVLRATSVLELAATWRTPELRGKRWLGQWRVSRLQSSRGWSGTPKTVRSSTRCSPASPSSHCLAPYGPGTAEFPPSVFASRVVVTTSSRTEFPTVRLLSSSRVRAGRRRRGGSRGPRS
ncbi:hypothetical protein Taro_005958 [Colocasia esculenta]|uniref:Uncharacterized protein n=1 Tax=Colocasia esculenta TaxID=4460 RepID=A0A843TR97_COLES|nr:hypothetical protein [Colocasia esculenta]